MSVSKRTSQTALRTQRVQTTVQQMTFTPIYTHTHRHVHDISCAMRTAALGWGLMEKDGAKRENEKF